MHRSGEIRSHLALADGASMEFSINTDADMIGALLYLALGGRIPPWYRRLWARLRGRDWRYAHSFSVVRQVGEDRLEVALGRRVSDPVEDDEDDGDWQP